MRQSSTWVLFTQVAQISGGAYLALYLAEHVLIIFILVVRDCLSPKNTPSFFRKKTRQQILVFHIEKVNVMSMMKDGNRKHKEING